MAAAEKILAELSRTSSYTKDDLTVAYSKNGVLGTTGFSVKTTSHINWNTGKFNKRGTLALENKTPLTTVVDSIELFSNHRITKKQVLNVMAAHVMPDDEILSEYNPALLFDGVIELITLYSFVNFIAGSGAAGDSSDFMLINGRPILVLDIVEHLMNEVINGKQAIKQQLTSKNAGLFNRDTFVAMNDKIEGDNDYETGMMRSNAVYKKLHEFKLDVSISMASLATLFGK